MDKEPKLKWTYNKGSNCWNSDYKGVEYFIETNHWENKRFQKLYVVANGEQNHVTGHERHSHLRKLAEVDLERKLNKPSN